MFIIALPFNSISWPPLDISFMRHILTRYHTKEITAGIAIGWISNECYRIVIGSTSLTTIESISIEEGPRDSIIGLFSCMLLFDPKLWTQWPPIRGFGLFPILELTYAAKNPSLRGIPFHLECMSEAQRRDSVLLHQWNCAYKWLPAEIENDDIANTVTDPNTICSWGCLSRVGRVIWAIWFHPMG